MTETTSRPDGDATPERKPDSDNDPRPAAEQADARQRDMEDSGEENAA